MNFGKNTITTTSSSSSLNHLNHLNATSSMKNASASASVHGHAANTANTANTVGIVSSFDKQIQKWIEFDNKLKKMNSEIKTMRESKNDIEASIMEIVNNKKLLNTSVATADGRLRFIETKTSTPLSLAFIEQCMHEIIPNKSQVQHILKYIKEKREIKINPEIKRYYN
jgi:CxxC motif-containing protein